MPRISKNKKKNKTETENQDDRPKWKPITMNELAEASLQFCIRPALAAVPNANGANNADGPSKAMNPTIHISPPVSLAENGGKKEEMIPIHDTRSRRCFAKFTYYFRHPYLRLLFAYGVMFSNFFIYAEDPGAHSFSECITPVIGNGFSFVANKYPLDHYFKALKVIMFIIAILFAIIFGKLVIHRLLLRRFLKLSMFKNDQGSWMIMFFTSILSLFIFSLIYNQFLRIKGATYAPYKITSKMGITNHDFMKAAALGTWLGDFVTAWMVTDMMLQETSKYPSWAKTQREWWNRGWHRVVLFWTVLVVLTGLIATVMITDYIKWDELNQDFIYTSEFGRGMWASFVLVLDVTIVMQDWDFPMFESDVKIKLPGINTAHIQFQILDCLHKEHWQVYISGKWFNYGVLFLIMLLDLNMLKNQIFYKPYDYGQYVGPDGKVYSVKNQTFLATANKKTLSYAWRWSHPSPNNSYGIYDDVVNSRFRNHSLAVTGMTFIPALLIFVIFAVMIWVFGRNEKITKLEVQNMHNIPYVRQITSISIQRVVDKENENEAPDADVTDFGAAPGHVNSTGGNENISKTEASNIQNTPYVRQIADTWIKRVKDKEDTNDKLNTDVTSYGAIPALENGTGGNENVLSKTEASNIQNTPFAGQIAETWIKRVSNKVDGHNEPNTDVTSSGAIPAHVNGTRDNVRKTEALTIKNKPYVHKIASNSLKMVNDKRDRNEGPAVDIVDYGAMPGHVHSSENNENVNKIETLMQNKPYVHHMASTSMKRVNNKGDRNEEPDMDVAGYRSRQGHVNGTGDNENVRKIEAERIQNKPYEPQIRHTWINRLNDKVTWNDEPGRSINDYGAIPEHPITFGDNVSHAYFFL